MKRFMTDTEFLAWLDAVEAPPAVIDDWATETNRASREDLTRLRESN